MMKRILAWYRGLDRVDRIRWVAVLLAVVFAPFHKLYLGQLRAFVLMLFFGFLLHGYWPMALVLVGLAEVPFYVMRSRESFVSAYLVPSTRRQWL